MTTREWIMIMVMAMWTLAVVLVTVACVSDREWKRHRKSSSAAVRADMESCNRFRMALDAFEKDLGPVSFHLIFSDHIFMAWQRGNQYIDLSWRRGDSEPVKASLRIDQCKMELVVDDLDHVLIVMRRWAAEHRMLLAKPTAHDVC